MTPIVEEEYLLKICLIGASKYKTQLVREYAEGKFTTNYLPTLGVDITTKKVRYTEKNIKLIFVDIAGQEFFGKDRPSYYRGASIALFLFELIDRTHSTRSLIFTMNLNNTYLNLQSQLL